MRAIKFRAWDECRKMMHFHNPKWIEYRLDKAGMIAVNYAYGGSEQQLPIMQYTGMTDRNGVEIYEGDIVRSFNEIAELRSEGEVYKAQSGAWVFAGRELWAHITTWGVEVIGNIHEHPELLEEKA